jgi:hypothetical protein
VDVFFFEEGLGAIINAPYNILKTPAIAAVIIVVLVIDHPIAHPMAAPLIAPKIAPPIPQRIAVNTILISSLSRFFYEMSLLYHKAYAYIIAGHIGKWYNSCSKSLRVYRSSLVVRHPVGTIELKASESTMHHLQNI